MIRIILFGGSFDPIHNGHLTIAKAALEQRKADALWFVPTKMSPFKDGSTDFNHRYEMIRLAIKNINNMHVSDVEYHLPSPSYTIDTLNELEKRYPNYHFEWLLGSDQLPRIHEWKEIERLQERMTFLVYNRNEGSLETTMPIIHGQFLDISSTAIREGLSTQAPKSVLNYMTHHTLYFKQHLKRRLSPKRFEHVMRVLELGESLALHHNVDVQRVRLAILAHDMCKEDDMDLLSNLMNRVYPNYSHLHPNIYHAFAAAHELSCRYYIKDKAVLDAVRSHVVGSGTHPISKIVYIADKCEHGRNYDTTPFVEMAFEDLNRAYQAVKKSAELYRVKKGN